MIHRLYSFNSEYSAILLSTASILIYQCRKFLETSTRNRPKYNQNEITPQLKRILNFASHKILMNATFLTCRPLFLNLRYVLNTHSIEMSYFHLLDLISFFDE